MESLFQQSYRYLLLHTQLCEYVSTLGQGRDKALFAVGWFRQSSGGVGDLAFDAPTYH